MRTWRCISLSEKTSLEDIRVSIRSAMFSFMNREDENLRIHQNKKIGSWRKRTVSPKIRKRYKATKEAIIHIPFFTRGLLWPICTSIYQS